MSSVSALQHRLVRQLPKETMRLLQLFLLFCLIVVMNGCAGHDPVWQLKAQQGLRQLQQEQAETAFPEEYASINKLFQEGQQAFLESGDEVRADQQFVLAYQKSELLKRELELSRQRLKEEALQKEIEEQAIREEEARARVEAERKRQQELAETQRKLQQESERKGAAALAPLPPQPTVYTVRRGETLPQIAARPELYNDAALWPLIYRANRDQIRDPYQLWPGQVLKIPRNFSRDEALEARRQAHRRNR